MEKSIGGDRRAGLLTAWSKRGDVDSEGSRPSTKAGLAPASLSPRVTPSLVRATDGSAEAGFWGLWEGAIKG